MLANERRRSVLSVLDDQETPVTLGTIAREVADHEATLASPDTDDVRKVQVSLHHVHLPKMTAFGVLEYDATTRRIES